MFSLDTWIDPDGHEWKLDFDNLAVLGIIREVMQVFYKKRIWAMYASKHMSGIGTEPDLKPAKDLKKMYQKKHMHRESYFLDAVVQGAMEEHAKIHFQLDANGQPVCKRCLQVVLGPGWKHLAYGCSSTSKLENKTIQGTNHFCRAVDDDDPKWLRGLTPIRLPDPLDMKYDYENTWEGILNVNGCIIGGDGSGGARSKDIRMRRCGFAAVVVRPNSTLDEYEYVGHAFGSVPGKQTVPRPGSRISCTCSIIH